MRSAGLLAAAVAALTATAEAQQPTLSRALDAVFQRDSTPAVWFLGAPEVELDRVVDAVRAIGGVVRHRSRWLHAVSAQADPEILARARLRPEFRHMQAVARWHGPLIPEDPALRPFPTPAAAGDSVFGAAVMPFRQLNLLPLARKDLTGAGVTIAILDTGFETELPAFAGTNLAAQWDFVFGDSVVRNESGDVAIASRHGTSTWSLLGANLPNTLVGVAPDATYLLAKTEDVRSETRVEEDHWVAAIEWADSLGADVVSSSLGYLVFDDGFVYEPGQLNGDVAVTTVAADSAAARGIVVVVSAGNRGPGFRTLNTPADADSIITAGAEDSLGTIASFSSRGPTADGRLKPDLTAPGVAVFVLDPLSATGFARQQGTSFSAPLLAGVAALYRQEHPTHSPAQVIAALKNAADLRSAPDSVRGWGRPNAASAVYFPRGVVLTTPADSGLQSVTPTLAWTIPDLSPLALPVRYRVRVARDTLFGTVLLDTTLANATLLLREPLPSGDTLVVELAATAADSTGTASTTTRTLLAPTWARLVALDEPDGVTIRNLRPTFRWESPGVREPPGPFTYDIAIFRADDGVLELEQGGLTSREYTPPRDLERNTPYRWRLVARLADDSTVVESRGTFLIIDDSAPPTTLLFQNFPNPFPNGVTGRRTTCLWFDLAVDSRVQLDILDLRGHVVRNLVPGDGAFEAVLPAGRYGRPAVGDTGQCDPRLQWDGTAEDGTMQPRGIYLARLETAEGTFLKRIVFMGPES